MNGSDIRKPSEEKAQHEQRQRSHVKALQTHPKQGRLHGVINRLALTKGRERYWLWREGQGGSVVYFCTIHSFHGAPVREGAPGREAGTKDLRPGREAGEKDLIQARRLGWRTSIWARKLEKRTHIWAGRLERRTSTWAGRLEGGQRLPAARESCPPLAMLASHTHNSFKSHPVSSEGTRAGPGRFFLSSGG